MNMEQYAWWGDGDIKQIKIAPINSKDSPTLPSPGAI